MIYFFIILFLFVLVIVFDIIGYRKGYYVFLSLSLFIFILISGLRYKVGGDTLVYMEEYESLPTIDEFSTFDISKTRYDYLWVVFCAFCKFFSGDYFFMQFVQAFIINIIYFYFICRNTSYRFTAILLYFLFGFLYFNTEIMRESVAIAVFLLAVQLYYSKKWLRYYTLCTIAFFIHSSALSLFLFPFVSKIKLNNLFFYSLILLVLVSAILWQQFKEYIEYVALVSSIQSKVNSYVDNIDFDSNLKGLIFGIFLFALLPLLFVFIAKGNHMCSFREAPFLWLYISFGIFTIFNVIIFTRFQNYLFFPFIVFLSNLVFDYKCKGKIYLLKVVPLLVILFVGRYFSYFMYEPNSSTYMYQRYFPYNSIISKEEFSWRK